MPRIYLDNSATSFPKAPGIDKVIGDYLTKTGCNLNRGGYSATCLSAKVAKEARAWLAELFNFPTPSNVVINSGVTYSLNTVLQGILKPSDHVLTSSLEHNAVTRPLHLLRERIGTEFECIPCDEAGRMRVDAVEGMLRPNTRMVVCTHASNVSGVITPLSELGAICRQHGVLFVVDSAQTAGILPIDMQAQCIDILCFAGHKGLFGPPGTGGFCVPDELVGPIDPLVVGGSGNDSVPDEITEKMPYRFEIGTPNIPGYFGLHCGVKFVRETGIEKIHAHEMALWQQLLEGFEAMPEARILGTRDANTSVAVLSVAFDGYDHGAIAYHLDHEYDVAVRHGHHCAPYAHRTYGTLEKGTIRFSPGFFNTPDDIEAALAGVRESLDLQAGKTAVRVEVGGHYADVAQTLSAQVSRGQAPETAMAAEYADAREAGISEAVIACSKGCANPVSAAALAPGERVLDLGSGAGLDVLVCAKAVGENGHVIGLDMTDEMLDLARANAEREGVANVEFVKGLIEDIPLPDACVDVVTSNCVINLSGDRDAALREAYRVLGAGGRLSIADLVRLRDVDADADAVLRRALGCTQGAFTEDEYRASLEAAGFANVEFTTIKVYQAQRVREKAEAKGFADEAAALSDEALSGAYASVLVAARKN